MSLSVALTGGIASGKSTVARMLAGCGAVVIDADVLAREVVEPGTPGLTEVVARFGEAVLAPDGTLDRKVLGEIVFGDAQARGDLNAIVHPKVRQRRTEIVAAVPDDAIVVSVIPLLVETGMADEFDAVIVVDMPESLQIERLMARNGLTEGQARARLAAQASRPDRLAVADWVIDNTGTFEHLRCQVDELWRQLRRCRQG